MNDPKPSPSTPPPGAIWQAAQAMLSAIHLPQAELSVKLGDANKNGRADVTVAITAPFIGTVALPPIDIDAKAGVSLLLDAGAKVAALLTGGR